MEELAKYLKQMSTAERADFAERCRSSAAYLQAAISGDRKLGESLCMRIEVQSRGAVRCKTLRPDVDWTAYSGWGFSDIATAAAGQGA